MLWPAHQVRAGGNRATDLLFCVSSLAGISVHGAAAVPHNRTLLQACSEANCRVCDPDTGVCLGCYVHYFLVGWGMGSGDKGPSLCYWDS